MCERETALQFLHVCLVGLLGQPTMCVHTAIVRTDSGGKTSEDVETGFSSAAYPRFSGSSRAVFSLGNNWPLAKHQRRQKNVNFAFVSGQRQAIQFDLAVPSNRQYSIIDRHG